MIYMLRSPLHFAPYTLHCTFHISTNGSSYSHNNLHGRTLTSSYLSFLLIRPQIMNSQLLMSHAYSIFMNDIYCFIYIHTSSGSLRWPTAEAATTRTQHQTSSNTQQQGRDREQGLRIKD